MTPEQQWKARQVFEESWGTLGEATDKDKWLTAFGGWLVAWGSALEANQNSQKHTVAVSDGIRLIAQERTRQIVDEGFTAEHDAQWTEGQLVKAAISYLWASTNIEGWNNSLEAWPWDRGWFKPFTKINNLIKAAALIVAEIERLQRTED